MKGMSERSEVLVAIVNNERDFAIIRDWNWYRIPVSSARKWLKDRWPPQWLAFYQTKVFGDEAYAVNYWARVLDIRTVRRWQLLPDEPSHNRSDHRYYQLILEPLQKLPQPILSRRLRRIVFIPTTWQKFVNAVEINDLYDESPLGDRLWATFKRHNIPAERQEFVTVENENYILDFAIYCAKRNIAVEANGDTWHANPEKARQDNLRNNNLTAAGWDVLRFTTRQIQEEAETYCIPNITKTINNSGGVDEGKYMSRKIDLQSGDTYQLGLYDDF